MCGRYTLRTPMNVLIQEFQLQRALDFGPRYNIAPTQSVPVIRQGESGREMVTIRWGLVPSWADAPAKGAPVINARSESVAEKPMFRSAIKARRCLIPADGFYEWEKTGKSKQPHYFHLAEGRPFAFAGLWEVWKKGEKPLESCTILTTYANALLAKFHDRMPVILSPNDHEVWLDSAKHDPSSIEYLYEPIPAADMATHPVDLRVNNVRNDDANCIAKTDAEPRQTELF